MFAEADKEVGSGVRIENGLEGDFAFVHFKRWRGPASAIAGGAQKVADHRNVGVQNLGCGSSCATQCYRWLSGRLLYWSSWNGGLRLCNRGGRGRWSRR